MKNLMRENARQLIRIFPQRRIEHNAARPQKGAGVHGASQLRNECNEYRPARREGYEPKALV